MAELGELVWVVDLNRQSLDRVVPDIAADKLSGLFAAAGWQVITVKYGQLLRELFDRPGGPELRARIDAMTNPEYQRLLRCDAAELRRRLPGTARKALGSQRWSPSWTISISSTRSRIWVVTTCERLTTPSQRLTTGGRR